MIGAGQLAERGAVCEHMFDESSTHSVHRRLDAPTGDW